MPLIYTGPHSFEHILQETYEKIAGDYERANPPVIVGYPLLWNEESNTRAFSSQDAFNAYVDEKLRVLISLRQKIRKRRFFKGKYSRAFMKVLAEVHERTSIAQHLAAEGGVSQGNNDNVVGGAAYEVCADVIYIDPYYASAFYLARGYGGREVPIAMNLPSHLQHELVHFDIGDCKIYTALRASGRKATESLQEFLSLAEVLKGGNYEDAQKWQEEKEGRAAFVQRILLLHSRGDVLEVLHQDSDELLAHCNTLKMTREQLHIDIGDEGLAYAYVGDKRGFTLFLNNRKKLPPAEHARALVLYDLLKDNLIEHQGKLFTLHTMKQAIDRAFTEKKDLFEAFL